MNPSLSEHHSERPSAINVLNTDTTLTSAAHSKLIGLNLSSDTYIALATVQELPTPDLVTDAESLARSTQKMIYNEVTGLKYERNVRLQILKMIIKQVLNGDKDLVMLTTDMNNLKKLNDLYGHNEANKGLKRFTTWVQNKFRDKVETEGKQDVNYAPVNIDGEGSDSIKLVYTMKDGYIFTRKLWDELSTTEDEIELTTITGSVAKEKINGGFGYYVLDNHNAKELTSQYATDEEKAGALYELCSRISDEKMTAEKVRDEAMLVNELVDAKTKGQLAKIRKKIVVFGARVPQIIYQYLFDKENKLGVYSETDID